MSFNTLKNFRVQNGNVYSFDNYKIYMIPSNKLKLGISPLIDKFINKELELFYACKSGSSEKIGNKYIYKILKKKETIIFFATQTIISLTDIWEDETLNEDLIEKLQSMNMNILDNLRYLNGLRKQLGLKRMPPSVGKLTLPGTIKQIKQQINEKSRDSGDNSRKSKNTSKGGGFIKKYVTDEHIRSFMFIEKQTPNDYYIHVECTDKIIDFANNNLPEYKFPWATYFLYIFLKSLGDKRVNIYNHAASKDVIYYHKRFLFNIGNKKCSEQEEFYNKSLAIPFNILKGPDKTNENLLKELIESLPDDYETSSGYGMKMCDIQDDINIAKIDNVEAYLKHKWDTTFNLPRLSISKKSIRSIRSPSKRRLSVSNTKNNKNTKKTKKLSRRSSYPF